MLFDVTLTGYTLLVARPPPLTLTIRLSTGWGRPLHIAGAVPQGTASSLTRRIIPLRESRTTPSKA